MAVALAPAPKIRHLGTAAASDSKLPALEDTFSLPPAWGGTWKDFFSIFKGNVEGLSRAQVLQNTTGDHQIISACFQRVIQEAVEAGLLVLKESGTSEEVEKDGLKAIKVDYKERIFLNDKSERLRSILATETSELAGSLEKFSKLNFQEIAEQSGQNLIGDYSARFLNFLSAQRAGKNLYMTDFYKNEEIYPDANACYNPAIKAFLDRIVFKAAETGILKSDSEPSGRPVFQVEEGLHELILKGSL